MAERWIKATKYVSHSQGTAPDETQDIWINMCRAGELFEGNMGTEADPKPVTSIEIDQDIVNVLEPISHFLPAGTTT